MSLLPSGNKLTGTIDHSPLYNLRELEKFDVSRNQLIGEFEALIAPSLKYADLSNNLFSSIPFKKYKGSFQTLQYFYASNNAIQQDATDLLLESIPPNIEQFCASNNSIYGNLPQTLNSLSKLRTFMMSYNTLYGDLPGFTESFTTLQELDLSNQNKAHGFTGSIPENIWRSRSLNVLNLAGNKLDGTISSLVSNLAVLEVFDVSNNRLQSSIPTELGMLDGE